MIAVGGGGLLDQLRANITRSGLSKQILTAGALDHGETLNILRAADVLMLTSAYEGISLSIFERMAGGAVPFFTDVGSQRELVTPDTGVLVPMDDRVVINYAKALRLLSEDPVTLENMKNAAHERISAGFYVAQLGTRIGQAICWEMASAIPQL